MTKKTQRNVLLPTFRPPLNLTPSECFTPSSLAPNPKASGNICWELKQLDCPHKGWHTQKFSHPPLLPTKEKKREQKLKCAPVKNHFTCCEHRSSAASFHPKPRIQSSMPKGTTVSNFLKDRILLLCAWYFFYQRGWGREEKGRKWDRKTTYFSDQTC